jgi:peptidoglycan-associated lipoprotein
MFRNPRFAVVVALLAITATACKKKPVVDPAPVAVNIGTGQVPTSVPTTNNTPVDSTAIRAARDAAIRATTANLLEAVYFDYDVSELSMAAQATLSMKAEIMRANPTVVIRIEGHCDSRGSSEYNLALGQRRAAAARQYLIDRGIPASRIQTVSLGEERPAMQGETEAAWARNRRDEFAITAGQVTNPVGN